MTHGAEVTATGLHARAVVVAVETLFKGAIVSVHVIPSNYDW
jgi:hypothetical protein